MVRNERRESENVVGVGVAVGSACVKPVVKNEVERREKSYGT